MFDKKFIQMIIILSVSLLSIISLGFFFSYYFLPLAGPLKLLQGSFFGLVKFLSLPPVMLPIFAILMLLLGLSFIFWKSLVTLSIAQSVFCILMLIFGLSSMLLRLSFPNSQIYNFHFFSLYPLLIFVSGLLYILSSLFLLKKKMWARKFTIIYSIMLMLYFIPVGIYWGLDPWGWGRAVTFSTIPYIIFPLFFIIFLTRPKIKEQFKK